MPRAAPVNQIPSLVRLGENIGPQLIHFLFVQNAVPRRHLTLTLHDLFIESGAVTRAKPSQIEGRAGIQEPLAVASAAVGAVDSLTCGDQLLILARCACRRCQRESHESQTFEHN